MESIDSSTGLSDTLRGSLVFNKDGNKLIAPTNIVKTVRSARNIYMLSRQLHIKRIQLYSMIMGLIAGNPPYNQAELAKHGLNHIANFNNLDPRSYYERGALAYWNLFSSTEFLAKFTIASEDPEARKMEDTISEEWNTVVRHWPSFRTQVNQLVGQLAMLGISPVFWPDERDWRWRTVELSKFFIEDQAESDIEKLTHVAIESAYTAQYLFEVYERYKDVPKDKSPWDCDELANLLLHLANTFVKTDYRIIDFLDMQKRLQNGDLGYGVLFSDAIRLVTLYYKEYEGQVSAYMFHRTFDNGNFLYFADRIYNSMPEALVIFTASPGEMTIHSNRGLGHKIFSICQAMMQVDCSIVDAMRWAATPLIKGVATGSRDVEQIRFYPGVMTNIGTAEFVPNPIGENINQLVGGSQYFSQKLQFNTASSGDDPGMPDRNLGSVAPSQARAQSYKEFGMPKNNINHFYGEFDRVIQNMAIKMLKAQKNWPGYEYAKEWKDRCIEKGVPPEIFEVNKLTPWGMPRQLSVKASRVAGDGSTLARMMGLDELLPIAGDFGPKAAQEYKRQRIMVAMGTEYVDAFMENPQQADAEAGGATVAGLENNCMQQGQSPVFSVDNEHRSHFATHMALATHTIQALQQQQTDPIAADKIFSVLVPHIQEHFQALAKSLFARTFVEQNKKNLGQVIQYATLNRKNAEAMLEAQVKQQQEQAQKQQQLMSDEQIKNAKAQGDEARATFKVQSQVQRAGEANQTRAEIMHEKIQKDSENKRYQIELDHQNKQAEVQGKNAINQQESASEQLRKMQEQGGPAPADLPRPGENFQ